MVYIHCLSPLTLPSLAGKYQSGQINFRKVLPFGSVFVFVFFLFIITLSLLLIDGKLVCAFIRVGGKVT